MVELRAEPEAIACLTGIDFWKRARLLDFFAVDGHRPPIFGDTQAALRYAGRAGKAVGYWPQRDAQAAFEARAAKLGVPVVRIEDGFIRSVGLGANLTLPASIVLDRTGMYYDPSRPSDLETILGETDFAPHEERARKLRRLLIDRRITKYNLAEPAVAPTVPPGRRKILVPGQFEGGKSVVLGGAGIATNAELLRRVRAANPGAFIAYKPHPDVDAGHRSGLVADGVLAATTDAVIRGGSILSLIDWADEVHTLTSLTGFEALLRERPVTTYGQPFYAGWGLTTDHAPVARRRRRLSIEALTAGVLILYARYVDPLSGQACGPETVIDRLAQPELWRQTPLARLRVWQGRLWHGAQGLLRAR